MLLTAKFVIFLCSVC